MKFRVLLVDDDRMILFLHRAIVDGSELPHDPPSFLNGKEVFSFLESHENENLKYLILLDLNMPEMNGWEFLEKLQTSSVKNRVYICVVTSSVNKSDRDRADQFPQVIDYAEKPINYEFCNRLNKKMNEAIAKQN